MILYTCTDGKSFGGLPKPLAHPCGRAAKALDQAGHSYEHKTVNGGTLKFWTWPNRSRDRAEIERLSGQRGVPILLQPLDLRFERRLVDADGDMVFTHVDAEGGAERRQQVLLVHLRETLDGVV